jgi:hypothetical protein
MTSSCVELIDLLASDVDLQMSRKSEPADRGERFQRAQEPPMSSIYPTLSVFGSGERHPLFRVQATYVLNFMHPEGEPGGCGDFGEQGLNRARTWAGQLGDEVAKLFPELRLRPLGTVLPRGTVDQLVDRPPIHPPPGLLNLS